MTSTDTPRQPGQGGDADAAPRDLRAELLKAEAAHYAKKNGGQLPDATSAEDAAGGTKRSIDEVAANEEEEDPEEKRRRVILEEARELDADSESDDSEEDSEDDDDDEEDETAVLMRELEKIKRERAEQRAKEEAEKASREEEQREHDIARGNPLLNPQDFNVKRRWDDDVVFKNQARGTEDKKPKEFVNDLLRSDFHRRFMVRITAHLEDNIANNLTEQVRAMSLTFTFTSSTAKEKRLRIPTTTAMFTTPDSAELRMVNGLVTSNGTVGRRQPSNMSILPCTESQFMGVPSSCGWR